MFIPFSVGVVQMEFVFDIFPQPYVAIGSIGFDSFKESPLVLLTMTMTFQIDCIKNCLVWNAVSVLVAMQWDEGQSIAHYISSFRVYFLRRKTKKRKNFFFSFSSFP